MNNRNVYMHGFVCDDAALFLDTHPDCPHARHLYQENAAQYNQAKTVCCCWQTAFSF